MKQRFIFQNEAGNEGGDSGGAGGAGANGAGAGGDSGGGDVQRPDFLPEKFWDAESKAPRLEEMAKSYSALETKIGSNREAYFKEFEEGRLSQRPESADAYQLQIDSKELGLPEGVTANIDTKDPLYQWWRETAYANGYTQEQFTAGINQYLKQEFANLPNMDAERETLGENAQDRISRVELWARKNAGDELFDKVKYRLGNADAVQFFEAIMKKTAGIDMSGEGQGHNAPLTKEQIRAMQDDPRYWKDRDPTYIKKVEEAWQNYHR